MFSLKGITSPVLVNRAKGLAIAQFSQRKGLPIGRIQTAAKESGVTVVALPVPLTGSVVDIPVTVTTDSVDSVAIAGRYYSGSLTSTPQAGQFYYDSSVGVLKVAPYPGNLPVGTPVHLHGTRSATRSDRVWDLPEWIGKYAIEGQVSINRSFNDHPQASINLIVDRGEIAEVRAAFSNRNLQWLLYNVPVRAQSISETIFSTEEYPHGLYQVSVAFEGWYAQLVNKRVFVRRQGGIRTEEAFEATECSITGGSFKNQSDLGSNKRNDMIRVSLQELAGRAGFAYLGYNAFIEYPKTTPLDATTTFASELDKVLRSKGLYAVYSNSAGVLTRDWRIPGTSTRLTASDVIEAVRVSKNLNPTTLPPTQLSWRDKDLEDTGFESELTKGNQKPEFEAILFKKKVVVESSEPKPSQPPASITSLKTLDHNFDRSGRRKVETTTHYLGESIEKQIIRQYGFAYLAMDMDNDEGDISAPPGGFWQLIEEITVEYLYDEQTGYALGTDTKGWKLARYEVETDALETIGLSIDAQDDPDAAAELQPYRFVRIPVEGSKRLMLAQFRDFYADIPMLHGQVIFYQKCDSKGRLVYDYVFDPRFVEERFALEEEEYYNAFSSMPNPLNRTVDPSNDEPYFPPKITGEERYVRNTTKVFRSTNTKTTNVYFKDYLISDPVDEGKIQISNTQDKYKVLNKTFSAQDAGFQNSLEDTGESISTGRPPMADKRPPKYRLIEEEPELETTQKDPRKPVPVRYRYIIYTAPYTTNDAVEGSWHFELADSFAEAMQAARVLLEVQDFQQRHNVAVTTFFNPYMEEGGRVHFDYAHEYFQERSLSVSSQLTILGRDTTGALVVKGSTQLALGTDSIIGSGIQVKKIKEDAEEDRAGTGKEPQELFIYLQPYLEGNKLGTILNTSIKNRGNF